MTRWSIDLVPKAQDDLARFDRSIRSQVIERLEWLAANFDLVHLESLHGEWRGFFKLRVGDWRVAYNFNASAGIITVHQIDRRDKMYKRRK